MFLGGSRKICMIWHVFPELDLYLFRSCTKSHNGKLRSRLSRWWSVWSVWSIWSIWSIWSVWSFWSVCLGFLVFSAAGYEWKGVEVHAALAAAYTLHIERQNDVKSLYTGWTRRNFVFNGRAWPGFPCFFCSCLWVERRWGSCCINCCMHIACRTAKWC